MKQIGICFNNKIFNHSTGWGPAWVAYCQKENIPYKLINCYSNTIISELDSISALLWHYSNYVISDILEAQNILGIAERKGIKVFPDYMTGWHFDDKIAEMYAFESVGAPIPHSWVFYSIEECIEWLNSAKYPIVAKLRSGSGSNNVKMIHNRHEGVNYAHRMFSSGYNPTPSFMYKAYSKAQSSKDLKMVIARIKKIPEFLNTRRHGKMLPLEKGYCYFQEFIPNDGYDLKVVVIGDKMTFLARGIRKNDFRASGGGDIYYDRKLLSEQIIDSAFKTADDLKLQCVGFDYVVDKRTGIGVIVEMCYGFDYEAQLALGAYIDRNHTWHEEALNIPEEIVRNIMKGIEK